MLTNPKITGIDPFVDWSTFQSPTLLIPRGLFYGGIFYTTEAFTPPCHISYISGQDEDVLSTWGIADATGKELGAITFDYDSPNVGNILTASSEYGGCLKGRLYNANNRRVPDVTSGSVLSVLNTSDLATFLYSIHGEHILDANSLILDCCVCVRLPSISETPAFNSLELPIDCELVEDENNNYYIAAYDASVGTASSNTTTLQELIISGGSVSVSLNDRNVVLAPWCGDCTTSVALSGGVVASGGALIISSGASVIIPPGGALPSGAIVIKNPDISWNPIGVEDVAVTVIDGGVVIGTKQEIGNI